MVIKIPVSFDDLVQEIVRFTNLNPDEVKHRVWMEAIDTGWNVRQDIERFEVTPNYYNNKMEQLYKEGVGFIFDSLVFWTRFERQLWIQRALDRIKLYANSHALKLHEISILMFGDGAGNDSLYLVNNGLNVNYFDVPGSKTHDFVKQRFDYYNVSGRSINIITDYESCLCGKYDVVVSFEVLEHLPDPDLAVRDIHSMLKPGGIALITESFTAITYHPTHLKSNVKFKTPLLFLKNKMLLSWSSPPPPRKPMEFIKTEKVSLKDKFSTFKDYVVLKIQKR